MLEAFPLLPSYAVFLLARSTNGLPLVASLAPSSPARHVTLKTSRAARRVGSPLSLYWLLPLLHSSNRSMAMILQALGLVVQRQKYLFRYPVSHRHPHDHLQPLPILSERLTIRPPTKKPASQAGF